MTLLDRHIEFVEALRSTGLPGVAGRGARRGRRDRGARHRRAGDPAGVVRRHAGQAAEPPPRASTRSSTSTSRRWSVTGTRIRWLRRLRSNRLETTTDGFETLADARSSTNETLDDGPQALADFREALTTALAMGDPDALAVLAREAVQRFGLIRGRGPGEQRWSSYNVVNRVSPEELVARALAGLGVSTGSTTGGDDDPSMRRLVEAQVHGVRAARRRGGTPPRGRGPRPRSTWLGTPSVRRSSRSTSPRRARPTSS